MTGEDLDQLVETPRSVELLLVDEISTCGAVALEIVSRRLHQDVRLLWRKHFNTEPPDDLGPFGVIGVVLMGDFAQLPLVLSTGLLSNMLLMERESQTAGSFKLLVLAGRRTFQTFEDVIRLRRIHQ